MVGFHGCTGEGVAARVELPVDWSALAGPGDYGVLRTVVERDERRVVPAAADQLRLVILPVPDAGAVVSGQVAGVAAGVADRQVGGYRAPFPLEVLQPVDRSTRAIGGLIVGHRLAGVRRGKDVRIAQPQRQRTAAPHALAEDVDAVGVGRQAGQAEAP